MLGCTGIFGAISENGTTNSAAPGSFPNDDEEEDYSTGPRSIYLHGHAASRLFKSPGEDKIPVCVAATSMQGIVLALTAFHNSCNYASAVVHGYASVVTDEAERLFALTKITDNLVVS
jgi:nitroimidazol reductase NimA-like FMN-containing flavoprotein (pyridoxamine 5'-phosphate oxidase superfamily)